MRDDGYYEVIERQLERGDFQVQNWADTKREAFELGQEYGKDHSETVGDQLRDWQEAEPDCTCKEIKMPRFKVVLEDQTGNFHAEIEVEAENASIARGLALAKDMDELRGLVWDPVEHELNLGAIQVFDGVETE